MCGGSSQPGVFQDVAGSIEFSGVCFLLLLFFFNQGLKAPEQKDVRVLTRSGTQRETKGKAEAFTSCSGQSSRANTNQ